MEATGELPADAANESATPMYFGNYEVLKSIGKGKFAIVYRAKKIGSDQVVALKRIAVDMMNDKAKEKCLKEVRLLQNLDHPNIIRYEDSFLTDNDLFIVYEWAAAGDLKRQLRKAQERGSGFEERVIWKYFSQISNAVKYMHDKRIMHRDLKPANIFLTLDGTIKVGDLGLSRELSEHTIQAHSKVGTPLYMSPEVLNKGEGYDFKSDIWSLGCLLYELAMLKSPFKAEGLNLYSLFQKISNGEYTKLPDNFSEELRNLTYAMLSTQPEERPEMSEVSRIAQEMRTLTADKSSKSRKKSIGGTPAANPSSNPSANPSSAESRPNSGAAPVSASSAAARGGQAEAKGDATGEPSPFRREGSDGVRQSSASSRPASHARSGSGGNGHMLREGSFKLEQVHGGDDEGGEGLGEEDNDNDYGNADSKPSSRPSSHTRNSYNQRQQQQRAATGPGEHSPDEGEDEATVGLGQGDYSYLDRMDKQFDEQQAGVVQLGSDKNNSKNAYNNSGSRKPPSSANNMRSSHLNDVQYDAQSKAREQEEERERGNAEKVVRPVFDPSEFKASTPIVPATKDYNSAINSTTNNNYSYNATSNSEASSNYTGSNPYFGKNTNAASNSGNNNTNTSTATAYKRAKNDNISSGSPEHNNNNSSSGGTNKGGNKQSGLVAPLPYNNTTTTNNNNNTNTNNMSSSSKKNTNNTTNTNTTTNTINANATSDYSTTLRLGTVEQPTATGRALEEHLTTAASAFAIMSTVYDKLIVLNCPLEDPNMKEQSRDRISRGRLLPFHFACDLQLYQSVAGHDAGFKFMQFKRFAYVALWLCGSISSSIATDIATSIDIHTDTPVMVSKQILRLTQTAVGGMMPAELNNITPTSLTSGYGVNVCTVLSHLADAALQAAHFEARGTVQVNSGGSGYGGVEGGDTGNGDEDDDGVEDEAVMVGSEDETGAHDPHSEKNNENDFFNHSTSGEARLGASMMMGVIDPVQWKQETDRVAAKLSAGVRRGGAGGVLGLGGVSGGSEWADHIDALKAYAALKSNSNSGGAGTTAADDSARKAAAEAVEGLASQLKRTVLSIESALNKIRAAESAVNKKEAVVSSALNYSTYKSELLERESRVAEVQKKLSEATHRLNEVQERCDEVSDTLNTRTGSGGDGGGDGAGGANIVRLKDGLKTIKNEIKEMSMGIIMLNHNLLSERIQQSNRGRQTPNQRRAKRQNAPKDSILSDDEILD